MVLPAMADQSPPGSPSRRRTPLPATRWTPSTSRRSRAPEAGAGGRRYRDPVDPAPAVILAVEHGGAALAHLEEILRSRYGADYEVVYVATPPPPAAGSTNFGPMDGWSPWCSPINGSAAGPVSS